MGTILNMTAIFAGGMLGNAFGRAIPQRFQDVLYQVCAVAVMFIGIGGAMSKMLVFEDGVFQTQGSMMMLLCLILGALLGEIVNIQGAVERLGLWLRNKSGSQNDSRFIDAFLTASLTVCVGAMAIVGAIEDGIRGNISILAAKSLLDLVIIAVMSVSMGRGCIFSLIPVGLVQGSVTLLASALSPVITTAAMDNLSYVGSVLIFCVGVNLLWDKGLRVANMLPALLFAVLAAFL